MKAQILAERAAPGASVVRVAMAHGINANIVHGWRKRAREQGVSPVATAAAATTTFVPLAIEKPMPPALPRIDIEVRRGSVVMSIAWHGRNGELGARAA
ncbi:transposase [Mitsuaria sp. WAJ17]|uniref:transposase n=1 Tax=Mitsuaria sp. WAJ17 TaxID=2761452 RepID=UPI0021021348|nr:transposase [Mitsuaria sp. WAJ17]